MRILKRKHIICEKCTCRYEEEHEETLHAQTLDEEKHEEERYAQTLHEETLDAQKHEEELEKQDRQKVLELSAREY